MIRPLTVLGSGYVVPYHGREPAGAEPAKLDLALLERPLRRGLSEVTKLFMHVAKLALEDAAVDARAVHVVFASAFGEIAVAEALMAEAYDANASSPARFRNSVHNTAPGLFSISKQSTLPSTAISAGWNTVAMGLVEASAQLAREAERVLLVYAEEPVPRAVDEREDYGPLAAAFVLAREGTPNARARLRQLERAEATSPDDHPLAGALALAQAFERRRWGSLWVGSSYRVTLEAHEAESR